MVVQSGLESSRVIVRSKGSQSAAGGDKLAKGGDQVSELTASRLSVYLRCLNALDVAGVKAVSSRTLAEQFHLNAAQIRKDLAYFGEFGVRGVGYSVRDLKRHLRVILGLDRGRSEERRVGKECRTRWSP